MSYTFPSASTVLVFNVAGGTETSPITVGPAPIQATAPKPTPALPAPSKPAEDKPAEQAVTDHEAHITQLLAEVPDPGAYAVGQAVENPDGAVPDKPPAPTKPLELPDCNTELSVPVNVQQNPNPLSLQVGYNGEVPRWKPGSIIKWTYFLTGWPGGEDQAKAVAYMMNQAALTWNSHNIGVKFEFCPSLKDSSFVLGYSNKATKIIAEAFFPNANDLSYINVYQQGIYSDWYQQLTAVFLHELGHVLGLRHEFAMDAGTMYEGGSVQFGPRDAYSVMNYRSEPPAITQNDINSAKAFYSFTGSYIGALKVTNYLPY